VFKQVKNVDFISKIKHIFTPKNWQIARGFNKFTAKIFFQQFPKKVHFRGHPI